MANEKECPFKKGSPDDFLLFRNVNSSQFPIDFLFADFYSGTHEDA